MNMGGTARTLDEADGAVPLEDGLMSMRGYAVLDDSASIALTDDGWVAEREPGAIDLYYFGYGADFAGLADFYRISGPQPLLLRYALGNWWSCYHRYSADEYLMLMDRFAERSVPVQRRGHRHGLASRRRSRAAWPWTGYTWNRRLFPDLVVPGRAAPAGMKVTLNVHPVDGVRPFEEAQSGRREGARYRPGQRPARPVRHRGPKVPGPPTSTSYTTRSKTTASTSGGSTGSRAA